MAWSGCRGPPNFFLCCFVVSAFGISVKSVNGSANLWTGRRLNEMWCRLPLTIPPQHNWMGLYTHAKFYTWFSRDTEFGGILSYDVSVFHVIRNSWCMFRRNTQRSVSEAMWPRRARSGRLLSKLNEILCLWMNCVRATVAAAACCCVESGRDFELCGLFSETRDSRSSETMPYIYLSIGFFLFSYFAWVWVFRYLVERDINDVLRLIEISKWLQLTSLAAFIVDTRIIPVWYAMYHGM